MKHSLITSIIGLAMVASVSTVVMAEDNFSILEGIQAEAMTDGEMEEVQGRSNVGNFYWKNQSYNVTTSPGFWAGSAPMSSNYHKTARSQNNVSNQVFQNNAKPGQSFASWLMEGYKKSPYQVRQPVRMMPAPRATANDYRKLGRLLGQTIRLYLHVRTHQVRVP